MTDSERRKWVHGHSVTNDREREKEVARQEQERYAQIRSKIDYAIGQLEACWGAASRERRLLLESLGHIAIIEGIVFELKNAIRDEFK